jgi:hypothetical protein
MVAQVFDEQLIRHDGNFEKMARKGVRVVQNAAIFPAVQPAPTFVL